MSIRLPSLKDIAEKAGCSISAASIVLNNSKGNIGVGEELRTSILEAAETLGYRQNYHARALKTGRSFTFGVSLPPPMAGDFFGRELERGIRKRISDLEYDLLVFGRRDPHRAFDGLIEKRIDGLVLSFPGNALTVNLEKRWPLVLIQRPAENGYPAVRLDPEPGLLQAAEHLAELGHRKVLYLGLHDENGKERTPERRSVFQTAAEKEGMSSEEIFITNWEKPDRDIEVRLDWYSREIEEKLVYSDDVTAVFCYNDFVGLALYHVLGKRGIRIPEDMSVIGFDNYSAGFAIPGLTTVSHMLPEIGAAAVDMLVEIIEKEQEYPYEVEVTVPAELVIKGSTGRGHC